MTADEFLNQLNHDDIVAAIKSAEAKTSGEIRVFISHKQRADALDAAQRRFAKLGMTKTRERNAVLIYVAPLTRKFAVVGDTGVHTKCGEPFWKELAAVMETHFRKGEFTQGILRGIDRAGDLLAQHFPRKPDDQNELPDSVATDE
ncbi:MAG: TPM domain-containing protein [Verrucomicrobia bacterium]|nr:TPM domain-containing protein [Verrucomicrobiota bacterium]